MSTKQSHENGGANPRRVCLKIYATQAQADVIKSTYGGDNRKRSASMLAALLTPTVNKPTALQRRLIRSNLLIAERLFAISRDAFERSPPDQRIDLIRLHFLLRDLLNQIKSNAYQVLSSEP